MTAFDAFPTSIAKTLAALAATLIGMTGVPFPSVAAEPVTTCGQVLDDGGYLTGDLDCSAHTAGAAVTLNAGALDLAGFTLTGNSAPQLPLESPESTVRCVGACEVKGPGTIANGAEAAISAAGKIRLQDVEVSSDGLGVSIGITAHSVYMTGCIVEGFPAGGVSARTRAKIFASTIRQNGAEGVSVDEGRVTLRDSSVTENGWAWFGIGVNATSAFVRASEISGNTEDGIRTTRILKLVGSRVADNHRSGLRHSPGPGTATKKPLIVDSEIVDNCVSPEVGYPCADVLSCSEPRAASLACGASARCGAGALTWGICSLD